MFKFQIIDAVTGEPEGVPYRYIGRCLMRMWDLNVYERTSRYTIKPVRVRE